MRFRRLQHDRARRSTSVWRRPDAKLHDALFFIQPVRILEPLEHIAADGQLMAYKHAGFWQPMDTLREKQYLEELWGSGKAPWQVLES